MSLSGDEARAKGVTDDLIRQQMLTLAAPSNPPKADLSGVVEFEGADAAGSLQSYPMMTLVAS